MAKKRKSNIRKLNIPKHWDEATSNRSFLRRTLFIMLLCGIVLFLPLIGTLFRLMIVDHDMYEIQAIDNQTRSTTIAADRGTI